VCLSKCNLRRYILGYILIPIIVNATAKNEKKD
jgi:hypothetical protein